MLEQLLIFNTSSSINHVRRLLLGLLSEIPEKIQACFKKKILGRICSIPPKKKKIANNIYFSLFLSEISTRSCENDWERPYTEVGFVLHVGGRRERIRVRHENYQIKQLLTYPYMGMHVRCCSTRSQCQVNALAGVL
jgi:hypothetical protein